MDVYIVGEDQVTKEIIIRIIDYCGEGRINVYSDLPARGGKIKQQINSFNKLSQTIPVILLMDLDAEYCPPSLITSLNINNKNDSFIINIAIDEAESWLMADRENFANFFQVDINLIPNSHRTKLNGRKYVVEMNFPCKSSLYLNKQILPYSRSIKLREQMLPKNGAVKGKEYNAAIIPYIKTTWDIDHAILNSDSLGRMIDKIRKLSSI